MGIRDSVIQDQLPLLQLAVESVQGIGTAIEIPTHSFTAPHTAQWLHDGVHFTQQGAEAVGNFIGGYILGECAVDGKCSTSTSTTSTASTVATTAATTAASTTASTVATTVATTAASTVATTAASTVATTAASTAASTASSACQSLGQCFSNGCKVCCHGFSNIKGTRPVSNTSSTQ